MPEIEQFQKYSDPVITGLTQSQIERRRTIGHHLIRPFFPIEIQTRENTQSKLANLVNSGYGVLELYTHLSEDDQFRLLASTYRLWPELISKTAYTPVAHHIYERARPFNDFFGVISRGIVTEDTIARGKNYVEVGDENGFQKVELDSSFGQWDYVKEARFFLENSGLVFVAPQLGRRKTLEQSNKRPVEILLRHLELANIAIVFAGIGFKRVANYQRDFSGLNVGRDYVIKFGPVLTQDELSQEADNYNLSVDQYCLWQLGQNVPTVYNKIPDPTPHSPPSQV